jgi:hypothetical protein
VQALQASAAGGSDNLWQKTNAEAAVAVKDEALREVERVQTFLKEVRVRLVRCMQDEFMRLCARRDLWSAAPHDDMHPDPGAGLHAPLRLLPFFVRQKSGGKTAMKEGEMAPSLCVQTDLR